MVILSSLQVERLNQSYTDLSAISRHIEVCGRTCYKSEDKITSNSAEKFEKMIRKNKHLSVLEHATIYLFVPEEDVEKVEALIDENFRKHSKFNYNFNNLYISTNLRCIVESNHEEIFLTYLSPYMKEFHAERISLRVFAPISLTREANRHRTLSVSERSTRYVNYGKDTIYVMRPEWMSKPGVNHNLITEFIHACEDAIQNYNKLIELGCTKQMAREVLPLGVMSEVVYTAFREDWNHFLELRMSSGAHPDMKRLAQMIKNSLMSYNNYL